MASKENKHTSNTLLRPRAKRNRFQSALRSHLRTDACLALAALVWSGSLLCLPCCASEPSDCHGMVGAGGLVAITSVKPTHQVACGGQRFGQRQRDSQNSAISDRSSKSKDKQQCCLDDSQISSQRALAQSFDYRIIASNQTPQHVEVESSPQSPEFIWRASVTNRGSTYLLCCLLRI